MLPNVTTDNSAPDDSNFIRNFLFDLGDNQRYRCNNWNNKIIFTNRTSKII